MGCDEEPTPHGTASTCGLYGSIPPTSNAGRRRTRVTIAAPSSTAPTPAAASHPSAAPVNASLVVGTAAGVPGPRTGVLGGGALGGVVTGVVVGGTTGGA